MNDPDSTGILKAPSKEDLEKKLAEASKKLKGVVENSKNSEPKK